jgi:hypothetical protein
MPFQTEEKVFGGLLVDMMEANPEANELYLIVKNISRLLD